MEFHALPVIIQQTVKGGGECSRNLKQPFVAICDYQICHLINGSNIATIIIRVTYKNECLRALTFNAGSA